MNDIQIFAFFVLKQYNRNGFVVMSTAYKCLNGRGYRVRYSEIVLMHVKMFPNFAYL